MRASYTSQQQIANNLRSVSQINIKTQIILANLFHKLMKLFTLYPKPFKII